MTAQDPNAQAFLAELHALLEKYGATILADVGFGSDTHGICGHFLRIELADPDCGWAGTQIFEIEQWELSANHITAALNPDN